MDALASNSKILQQTQESVVKCHAVLVKRIAHHLLGRLPQSIQLDDLVQAGMIGLLEAVSHYDESKGASFETYAGIRIRGAMLDEVRKNDWVPRSVYRNSRRISEVIQGLENKLGRIPKDFEIAEALDIPLQELHLMQQDSLGGHLYGLDDLVSKDDFLEEDIGNFKPNEPFANVQYSNFMGHLAEIIDTLPAKEKLVVSLYYHRDLNLKEVGEVIGVSESRISQILNQATIRIKTKLEKF